MFCPKCGSSISDHSAQCPVCGELTQTSTPHAPQKTKSKILAAILMYCCVGDLYLLQWKRWFIKMVVISLPTLGLGPIIWSIVDAIRILNGTINCDAKGTPLV